MDSAGIGGREASEKRNHLSLALKNKDFHHSAALGGEGKAIPKKREKTSSRILFSGEGT